MNWTGVLQLNSNLTVDPGFDFAGGINDPVYCVAPLANGSCLIGGDFSRGILQLSASGGRTTWDMNLNGAVRAMLPQTDGRVIVVGGFTTADTIQRERALRLSARLELEPAYDPSAGSVLHAVASQADGKTLVGGLMATIGGETRQGIARLWNDSAESTLTVHSASRVSWLRGAASAEAARVTFEVNTGSGYADLPGTPRRLSGGWELTGLSLAGTGTLRARIFPSDSHSSSVLEALRAFVFEPEIALINGQTPVASGGTLDFGSSQNGTQTVRRLTVTNTGLAPLTITLPLVIGGTAAASFAVITNPLPVLQPGVSAFIDLRLSPTTEGSKVATLTLASDDPDEASYLINLTAAVTAGPGGVDASWQPTANAAGRTMALRDSELLLAGDFSAISGVGAVRYARLNTTSVTPQWLGSTANNRILCVLATANGQWLVGGDFTSIRGVARNRLARLNADGSVDTTFNPNVTGGIVACLAVDEDERIYVGGHFSKIGNVSTWGFARLTASGAMDAQFNVNATVYQGVNTLSLGVGGKIYVGGRFLQVGSHPMLRPGLARFSRDGTIDMTFNYYGWAPPYTGPVEISHAQETAEGIIVLEHFADGSAQVRRVTYDGATDPRFTPLVNLAPRQIAVQANGAVIVSGSDALGAATLARYTPAGVLDASFTSAPTARQWPTELALAETGLVYVTQERAPQILRLINQPASVVLSVPSADRVVWSRGGTAPEAQRVWFDLSQDSGSTWTRLGDAARLGSTWVRTTLNLPRDGMVRAWAVTSRGMSSAVHSYTGLAVPDLSLEAPVGTELPPVSGSVVFGPLLPRLGSTSGQTTDRTITLRNTGEQTVTSLVLTATGDFSVLSLGLTELTPGQSTEAIVRFAPTAIGVRTGTLRVTSNVPGQRGIYEVGLTGSGIALPLATGTSATLITRTQARLRGTVRANHETAQAWMEYKATSAANWIKPPNVEVTGWTSVPLEVDISGLLQDTAYHYRMGIYNTVNTPAAPVYSATIAFRTAL